MKRDKRSLARFLVSVVSALILVAGMASMAFAEGENENVIAAREGVVHIRVVFQGDDGDYDIQWGTGFLINDLNVVTCYHVIDVDSDLIEAIQESSIPGGSGKTEKQIRDKIVIKVSVVRDSFINANVVDGAYSQAADFCTLKLTQSLGGAKALSLRNSDEVNVTEAAYVLGYPYKQVLLKGYNISKFTDETVDVTQGSIKKVDTDDKGVSNVYMSGMISSGYSGGPMVDADGNVIGIAYAHDEDQSYAIASKEIMAVFDRLQIEYQTAGSAPAAEPEEQVEEEVPIVEPEPEKTESKFPVVPVVIGAIALIAIIVVVIILISNGKKKKAPANAPAPSPAPAPQGRSGYGATSAPQSAPRVAPSYSGGVETGVLGQGSGETSVLGQGSDATTVLSQGRPSGFLVRNKTGERIEITRDNFVIGKERSKVDYCVSDNTNISRKHCRIVSKNGETFIVDGDNGRPSSNGTFVNDVKSATGVETRLKNGDRITLADETFVFNAK